jgi:hypothetical protein
MGTRSDILERGFPGDTCRVLVTAVFRPVAKSGRTVTIRRQRLCVEDDPHRGEETRFYRLEVSMGKSQNTL